MTKSLFIQLSSFAYTLKEDKVGFLLLCRPRPKVWIEDLATGLLRKEVATLLSRLFLHKRGSIVALGHFFPMTNDVPNGY